MRRFPNWILVVIMFGFAITCCGADFTVPEPGRVAGEPITVTTRIRIAADISALSVIEFGGVAASPDAKAPALALVWEQIQSGWFPIWRLRLVGSTQLLSGEISLETTDGIARVDLPATRAAMPTLGHTYEATLSYAPPARRVGRIGVRWYFPRPDLRW